MLAQMPTPTITFDNPLTNTIGALEPVRLMIGSAGPGVAVDLRIDGAPVIAAVRPTPEYVFVNAWCDTRDEAPGLHRLDVTVTLPDGSETTVSRYLTVVAGEPADLPPAPPGTEATPVVVRVGDPGLGAALAATAAGGAATVVLTPDAELAPGALEWLGRSLAADGGADAAIGDEASRLTPTRWRRWRKLAFQPEALPELDQVGPLLAVGPRAARVLAEAEPDGGWAGASTYALALELVDHGLRTLAAGRVLTLTPEVRLPVDDEEGRAAVRRLAERRGRPVEIGRGRREGLRSVRWPLSDQRGITVVVPSRTRSLAAECLDALASRTEHPDLRVVLVDSSPEGLDDLTCDLPLTHVRYPVGTPFNYQLAVNLGTAQAPAEHDVLFLNDDAFPLGDPTWLTRMQELLSLPRVGIVGALLRYADGRVQHGGVAFLEGSAHLYHDAPADTPGRHFDLLVPGNPEAVSGACLLARREVLEELDGHDEAYVHVYGDVDLCFRAVAVGWRIAWCAAAELEHRESTTYKDEMNYDDQDRFIAAWSRDRDTTQVRRVMS